MEAKMTYEQAINERRASLVKYNPFSKNPNHWGGFSGIGAFIEHGLSNIQDYESSIKKVHCPGSALYAEQLKKYTIGIPKKGMRALANGIFSAVCEKHGRFFAQEVVVSLLETIDGVQVITQSCFSSSYGINDVFVKAKNGRFIEQTHFSPLPKEIIAP
jgi:hypothetical protein